jgi:predicted ATPase
MIKSLHVEGFKCFDENTFLFSPLTILAGKNASGKTSLLQLMALMHQTVCENGNFQNLMLNGPVVNLGRASDILHKTKTRNTIKIAIEETNKGVWKQEYIAKSREDFILKRKSPLQGKDSIISDAFHFLTYLSSDRLGPREMHSLDSSVLYENVGVRGERSISRLLQLEEYNVLKELCIQDTSPLLIRQVEAHLQHIFPGFKIDIRPAQGTNVAIIGFATSESVGFVRPQNIGFGLSYTLPIYISCLSAKKGDILLKKCCHRQ